MLATTTVQDKPTMTLNLSDQTCPEYFLKHLVIHEFGHALGLEHEDEQSDFWDVVKRFIDIENMKYDHYIDFLLANEKAAAYEYDSESIMHCR